MLTINDKRNKCTLLSEAIKGGCLYSEERVFCLLTPYVKMRVLYLGHFFERYKWRCKASSDQSAQRLRINQAHSIRKQLWYVRETVLTLHRTRRMSEIRKRNIFHMTREFVNLSKPRLFRECGKKNESILYTFSQVSTENRKIGWRGCISNAHHFRLYSRFIIFMNYEYFYFH